MEAAVKLAKAGKGHLILGIVLVVLSLTLGILSIFYHVPYFGLLTYFFGVWGGVETGRFIESRQKYPFRSQIAALLRFRFWYVSGVIL